jgi:7-cyano-7-deazaguanine reductase
MTYTKSHSESGLKDKLPAIEVFPNHFKKYEIEILTPEFTSICPKTGFPDFGKITVHYMPHKSCVELKSFKMYLLAYRNLGIFNENAVNRILNDIVSASKPEWAEVMGEFTSRGGLSTTVVARFPRK